MSAFMFTGHNNVPLSRRSRSIGVSTLDMRFHIKSATLFLGVFGTDKVVYSGWGFILAQRVAQCDSLLHIKDITVAMYIDCIINAHTPHSSLTS
jgi:hypothetical protein